MKDTGKEVKQLVNNIRVVLKSHSVKRASLFGSYVRGDNRENSDVDILVELEKGKSLLDLVRLERELSKNLRKKVDLITYKSINPHVKDYILRDTLQIL